MNEKKQKEQRGAHLTRYFCLRLCVLRNTIISEVIVPEKLRTKAFRASSGFVFHVKSLYTFVMREITHVPIT